MPPKLLSYFAALTSYTVINTCHCSYSTTTPIIATIEKHSQRNASAFFNTKSQTHTKLRHIINSRRSALNPQPVRNFVNSRVFPK